MNSGESELKVNLRLKRGNFQLCCNAQLPGGVTAVYGPSGSGKTTLLNCVAGFTVPDDGEIRISGTTFFSGSSHINLAPEKRRVGYVLQESGLFPHLSVEKNIEYGFNLTPKNLRKYTPRQLIEMMDITHLSHRDTKDLSGGERQRVALSRSLASAPQLLLLDEPLASIDAPSRGFIIQKLKMISDEMRIPVLYVSHSLSEVIAIADHVLVLSEGSVAAEGSPNILLGHPDVKKLSDFNAFENFLEGIVISEDSENYVTTVAVGDVNFLVSHTGSSIGSKIILSIRASDVILSGEIPSALSARNVIKATVSDVHFSEKAVLVECDFGEKMLVEITRQAQQQLDINKTSLIYLIVKASSIMTLDK